MVVDPIKIIVGTKIDLEKYRKITFDDLCKRASYL